MENSITSQNEFQGEQAKIDLSCHQQREAVWQETHQSNDEVVQAVIAGFLLQHINAFNDWIGDLNPSERKDCLSWILKEQRKSNAARRRLAWVDRHDDQAMKQATAITEKECLAAFDERQKQIYGFDELRSKHRSLSGEHPQ